MEALWKKVGRSLVPWDVRTADLLERTEEGALVFTSEPHSHRNPQHHKLIMAILTKVVEHSDDYADLSDLIFDLKLRCKMGKFIVMKRDGTVVFVPKSLSFAAMSQQEFRQVADRWLDIIATEILPGVDPESLLDEASKNA